MQPDAMEHHTGSLSSVNLAGSELKFLCSMCWGHDA